MSSASRAAADLLNYNYCKQALPVVKEQRDLLLEKDKTNQQITKNLNLQIDVFKNRSDEYQRLYANTSEALVKEQESRPSRFTWFGIGAISTAVAIIVGIFALK